MKKITKNCKKYLKMLYKKLNNRQNSNEIRDGQKGGDLDFTDFDLIARKGEI